MFLRSKTQKKDKRQLRRLWLCERSQGLHKHPGLVVVHEWHSSNATHRHQPCRSRWVGVYICNREYVALHSREHIAHGDFQLFAVRLVGVLQPKALDQLRERTVQAQTVCLPSTPLQKIAPFSFREKTALCGTPRGALFALATQHRLASTQGREKTQGFAEFLLLKRPLRTLVVPALWRRGDFLQQKPSCVLERFGEKLF